MSHSPEACAWSGEKKRNVCPDNKGHNNHRRQIIMRYYLKYPLPVEAQQLLCVQFLRPLWPRDCPQISNTWADAHIQSAASLASLSQLTLSRLLFSFYYFYFPPPPSLPVFPLPSLSVSLCSSGVESLTLNLTLLPSHQVEKYRQEDEVEEEKEEIFG